MSLMPSTGSQRNKQQGRTRESRAAVWPMWEAIRHLETVFFGCTGYFPSMLAGLSPCVVHTEWRHSQKLFHVVKRFHSNISVEFKHSRLLTQATGRYPTKLKIILTGIEFLLQGAHPTHWSGVRKWLLIPPVGQQEAGPGQVLSATGHVCFTIRHNGLSQKYYSRSILLGVASAANKMNRAHAWMRWCWGILPRNFLYPQLSQRSTSFAILWHERECNGLTN